MLKLITCDCGGAEPLVRNVLRDAKVPNWMTYEIHKGKAHCQKIVSYLPPQLHGLLAFRALESYLESQGTFAIIIGYDDNSFFWEDVHTNAPIENLRARAIVERFA